MKRFCESRWLRASGGRSVAKWTLYLPNIELRARKKEKTLTGRCLRCASAGAAEDEEEEEEEEEEEDGDS